MKTTAHTILIGSIFIYLLILSSQSNADVYYDDTHIWINGNHSLRDLVDATEENFEIIDRVCYLKKPLHLTDYAVLNISRNDCKGLFMYPHTYIRIAGDFYANDVFIYSFDPETNQSVSITREEYNKTRPYIYTKSPAGMFSAVNVDFGYLGYYKIDQFGSKWGVALYDLPRAEIINSSIHHNYFGLYTFNTTNLTVAYTKVHDNLEYGLDFHDFSKHYLIYRNEVYRNGNHGLIFSKWCYNNSIIENKVYDHTQHVFVKSTERDYGTHGIMLHHDSSHNIVRGNYLNNNRISIYLMDSGNNIVENNQIWADLEEGMYLARSHDNIIRNNTIHNSKEYSLYSYQSLRNTYEDNYFSNHVYLKDQDVGDLKKLTFVPEKVYVLNNSIYIDDYATEKHLIGLNSPLFTYGNGTCHLKAPLIVPDGAILSFMGMHCNKILLYENSSIEVLGSAVFKDISFTSHSELQSSPILYKNVKRPYIYVHGQRGYFFSINVSYAHLGYEESPYTGIHVSNKNNTFFDGGEIYQNYHGLWLEDVNNSKVSRISFHDNEQYGLVFKETKNMTLLNSYFKNNKGDDFLLYRSILAGLYQNKFLEKAANPGFEKNIALRLYFANNNSFYDNLFLQDAPSLIVKESRGNTFVNNVFSQASAGNPEEKVFMVEMQSSEENLFFNNSFDNSMHGIVLKNSDKNALVQNDLSSSLVSFELKNSNENGFYDNKHAVGAFIISDDSKNNYSADALSFVNAHKLKKEKELEDVPFVPEELVSKKTQIINLEFLGIEQTFTGPAFMIGKILFMAAIATLFFFIFILDLAYKKNYG